jgi:hypothetical protein
MRTTSILSLLLCLSFGATSAEQAAKVSGTFSSLEYHAESGDLTGWEVTLIPQADGSYFALVQIAEGQAPEILTGRAIATGATIRLTVAGKGPLAGTYVGTVTAVELRLKTPVGNSERLKRKRSYWQ